ncbi:MULTISPECIES: hypothetical protein [unclassified Streptomyces]|nr:MULTISPECIES: hypothetical protein [unclassified Streptomyces]
MELDITPEEALARMRARAFGTGGSLPETADEVIADPAGWARDTS